MPECGEAGQTGPQGAGCRRRPYFLVQTVRCWRSVSPRPKCCHEVLPQRSHGQTPKTAVSNHAFLSGARCATNKRRRICRRTHALLRAWHWVGLHSYLIKLSVVASSTFLCHFLYFTHGEVTIAQLYLSFAPSLSTLVSPKLEGSVNNPRRPPPTLTTVGVPQAASADSGITHLLFRCNGPWCHLAGARPS